jgi:hypothetical protein
MTNKEMAQSLAGLATVYGAIADNAGLPQSTDHGLCGLYCQTKDQVIAAIRAIGGRFNKRNNDDYFMYYDSVRLPGVYVYIDRSKVCRRLNPIYECEPLLSPEEEAEILTEAGA